MKKDQQNHVAVVFRKYRKFDEVIALFPYLLWNRKGDVTGYVQNGQHVPVDYEGCIAESRPATEEEIKPLLGELNGQGYSDLRILKRRGILG